MGMGEEGEQRGHEGQNNKNHYIFFNLHSEVTKDSKSFSFQTSQAYIIMQKKI